MVETVRPQMTVEYGACALHAGYLRLQTQIIICNIAFPQKNGYVNAPQYYVIRTLPVLL
jgi:hypothetical protein